jgi:HEAT repeat protein
LRLDPKALAAVLPLLQDQNLDPKLASLWLSALATSGSDAAQEIVLGVFNDQALGAATRSAAAGALFEVRQPSAALLAALVDRVDGLARSAHIDGLDATGLLALGAFARNTQDAATAVERFGTTARNLGAEDLWLDAMANARSPRLGEAAIGQMAHAEPHVLAAAARALRDVNGARALAALQSCASSDASPDVRATALGVLAGRPEPEAREAVVRALVSEPSAEVRRSALLALALRGVRDTDQTTLRVLAERDADADVRALANRLLAR